MGRQCNFPNFIDMPTLEDRDKCEHSTDDSEDNHKTFDAFAKPRQREKSKVEKKNRQFDGCDG